jgi:putative membrane protein
MNSDQAPENISDKKVSKLADHLANERTFLAWIRTCIAIMAFGFVVVKFTLFIKQLSILLGKSLVVTNHGYASVIGIGLVFFGVALSLFSFFQFKRIEKQLFDANYKPSSSLSTALIVSILLVGMVLIAYLVFSVL